MKTALITLLAFTLTIGASRAADPVVTVNSATSVTIDGQEYGKPMDVIANNPRFASAIQRALESWAAAVQKGRDDAIAELAAKNARIQTVLNTHLEAELVTGEGPRAQLLRTLLQEQAKPQEQVRREALEAEIAAKQAELEQLTNP